MKENATINMSNDYQRFLNSMELDYDKWHDGVGYDLDALRELSPDEQDKVEDVIYERGVKDWRDVDALAAIGSETALSAVKNALRSDKYEVRIAATEALLEKHIIGEREVEAILVDTIPLVTILNGQTFTLRLAERFPTSAVKRVLLWCALYGNDDIRVHAAALIHFLHGIAASSFDWDYRPFYLRFGDEDVSNRRLAYDELCNEIQVDPHWAILESA
jgi:hypothetical protein